MKTFKITVTALAMLIASSMGISTIPVTNVNKQDLDCLAKNIYHEARGEPIAGQLAVAQVTLNRVEKFKRSVCKVVYAHKQFSWTLDKSKQERDKKAWQQSLMIAEAVLAKRTQPSEFKALYFHTKQVNPKWNRKKQIVAKIGNHIFYA